MNSEDTISGTRGPVEVLIEKLTQWVDYYATSVTLEALSQLRLELLETRVGHSLKWKDVDFIVRLETDVVRPFYGIPPNCRPGLATSRPFNDGSLPRTPLLLQPVLCICHIG